MKNTTIDELFYYLLNESSKSSDALNTLVERADESIKQRLLQVMEETEDNNLRNAIAVALSDLKYLPAFDALLLLLKDEKTIHSRGTLLYALSPYDCSQITSTLAHLVADGNFEVSHEAFSLIKETKKAIPPGELNAAQRLLNTALLTASNEKKELITELLTFLEFKNLIDDSQN